jgi:hypothetical protein
MPGLWEFGTALGGLPHLHEPPHVHVDRDAFSAKFWLDPVALAYNLGYAARELRRIEALVSEHKSELLEAWHGYFGT